MTLGRRGFLRGASGALGFFGAAAAMNKVLSSDAFAATLAGYGGYRAIVNVFLLGGNDGNNVLVPLTESGGTGPYDRYLAARPNVGLKKTKSELLPISPVGLPADSYGVHFKMTNVKALFDAGKAAFICNAGPLVTPLTKTTYLGTGEKPESLFSHPDQQDAWASAIANPHSVVLPPSLQSAGRTGWGGRVADRIDTIAGHGGDGLYPETVFFSGKGLFGVGAARKALAVGATGMYGLKAVADTAFMDFRDETLAGLFAITNDSDPEEAYGNISSAAMIYADQRNAARDAAWTWLPVATRNAINAAFGTTTTDGAALAASDGSLKSQIYQTIRDIVAGAVTLANGGLGLRRQIFSVGLGGFDTHSGQRAAQDALLDEVDDAIGAFQGAIEAIETSGVFGTLPPQATLFTMSDFGRTLVENADGGSDHAWGNHVIVVGSRVAGQKLYGAYPNLDMSGGGASNNDTTDSRGRWIPTLCVDQVANTLAIWLGANNTTADRPYLFPNIQGFVDAAVAGGFPAHTKQFNLGFMLTG